MFNINEFNAVRREIRSQIQALHDREFQLVLKQYKAGDIEYIYPEMHATKAKCIKIAGVKRDNLSNEIIVYGCDSDDICHEVPIRRIKDISDYGV